MTDSRGTTGLQRSTNGASSLTTTIKAVRGSILLGDISLNVYMLPNGEYKLAGRNVTDAIGEVANSLLRKMGVRSLKDLPNAGSSLLPIKMFCDAFGDGIQIDLDFEDAI